MSTVIGAMEAYLKLNIDDFEKNLAAAKKQVESISAGFDTLTAVGDKIAGVGTALTVGLTTPIVGLGAACVKTTSDFDSIMSKVSAISGTTGKDLDTLRDKAKEMGAQTKFSAVEAGEAFTYMAMAGWDTQQMIAGISGIMDLAAADGLDLATTSDIVTDALTAFGLQAKDSGHFADVLAKASSSANTNVSMLGESFKYVAPLAGAMGYSVEDTAVALGLMANSGIKAGQAGTALRAALSRMSKPTDKAAELMNKYGLSITNTDGTVKSLSEVMTMLRDNMGELTEAEQLQSAATIFGQEAMSGMLAIINASDEDFNKLTGAINSADGTAQEMAKTLQDNLSGGIEELTGALETLAISFGELLIPIIREFVGHLQTVVDWLNSLDESTQRVILTVAAVAAAIGPVLLIFGKVISFIGTAASSISNLVALIEGAISTLGAAGVSIGSIAGPVGIVIAAIAALIAIIGAVIAAIVHMWKTSEDFRNSLARMWGDLKEAFAGIGDAARNLIDSLSPVIGVLKEIIAVVWQLFSEIIGAYVIGYLDFFVMSISACLDVVSAIMNAWAALFRGDWEGFWKAIGDYYLAIWSVIEGYFRVVFQLLYDISSAFLHVFGLEWEDVMNFISNIITSTWEWVKQTFLNLVDFFFNTGEQMGGIFESCWTSIKATVENAIGGITGLFDTYFPGWQSTLSGVMEGLESIFENGWMLIKNIVGGYVLTLIDLVTLDFDGLKSDLINITENIKTALSGIWQGIVTVIKNYVEAFKINIVGIWSFIKDATVNTWNAITTTISNAVAAIKNWIITTFNAAKTAAINTFNAMRTGIQNAVTNIKTTIVNGFNNAVAFIKSLPSQAFTWGKDMITGFKNGITSAMNSLLSSVKNVADKIRSYLHFSRPDVGPLRDYETWMPDMISGLSKTLEAAAPGLLDTVGAMSRNIADAMSGGEYQLAIAGADIRAGGNDMASNNYSALTPVNQSTVSKTEINISKIEVRDDHDLDVITQGMYNKQDQNLRALGRRSV